MPPTRWVLAAAPDPPTVFGLRDALGCSETVARLLVARGISTAETAGRFFAPTLDDLYAPHLMLGMLAAVARIQRAVALAEPILIYGDYDVDGTTATVLLKTAIERTAPHDKPAQVSYHVPHRLREGYGIQNVRLVEAAAAGIRLVISVDTGIRAFAAADEAKALGLDLIVTDHHLPDGVSGIPDAVAVINPAQPGCPYPNKHLCGAGVAFKLAHALLAAHATTAGTEQRLRNVILPSFLKLVAIATIADSVELEGENRAIVFLGLRELRNPVQPGLRALMQFSKLPLDRSPSASEVGFRIAPRINAAGRMDIASDVVELFLTRDAARAQLLAEKLDLLNQDRRASEATALEAIELQLLSLRDAATGEYAAECILLDHPEWHRGVLGILASRVVDRTGRPAIVMTTEDGQAHGSGRSITGFHLLDALTFAHTQHRDGLFSRFGGHAHAVGFSLPGELLPDLRGYIHSHSASVLTAAMLLPQLFCDLELAPEDLTLELARSVARFAPFGMGNREPVFLLREVKLAGPPRAIKDRHICLPLAVAAGGKPVSAMGWSRSGQATWTDRAAELKLARDSSVDLVFHLCENTHATYGGLELQLIDLRLATKLPAAHVPAAPTARDGASV